MNPFTEKVTNLLLVPYDFFKKIFSEVAVLEVEFSEYLMVSELRTFAQSCHDILNKLPKPIVSNEARLQIHFWNQFGNVKTQIYFFSKDRISIKHPFISHLFYTNTSVFDSEHICAYPPGEGLHSFRILVYGVLFGHCVLFPGMELAFSKC